jgi:hypothetical protein
VKRDFNGDLIYNRIMSARKYYPVPIRKWGIEYDTEKIELFTDNGLRIFAYRYICEPHWIKYNNAEYDLSEIGEYPELVKENVLNHCDLKSNCFGYVFTEGLFWLEPQDDNCPDIFKKEVLMSDLTIQRILKGDGYREIEKPINNAIALFKRDEAYVHAAKTDDGKTWKSKKGVNKKIFEETLEELVEGFGRIEIYVK